jgi:hypothetical protein
MFTLNNTKLVIAALAAALLTACGGGGGGGTPTGPVTSTNTFNFASGYQRLTSAGMSKTFTLSGTCNGTMTITISPANTSTTFEGAPALSATRVTTMSLTNCTPTTSVDTETDYFNTDYVPRGYSVQGGEYGVATSLFVLPTAVRVGDAAVVGSENKYSDSTKVTPTGREDISYVVEPDTATTAIVNLIIKHYNNASTLTQTLQQRYRVAADGALTPISLDVQFANGSTTHLVGN